MAQAKTLSKAELKQLLDVTNSCSRYPLRDSTMLLFTHLCGLRVGEVAALRFDDILAANGNANVRKPTAKQYSPPRTHG